MWSELAWVDCPTHSTLHCSRGEKIATRHFAHGSTDRRSGALSGIVPSDDAIDEKG